MIRSTGSVICRSSGITAPGPISNNSARDISRAPNRMLASSSISSSLPKPFPSTMALLYSVKSVGIEPEASCAGSAFDGAQRHAKPCHGCRVKLRDARFHHAHRRSHLAHRQFLVVVERQDHPLPFREFCNRLSKQTSHLVSLALQERIVLRACRNESQ